MIRKILVLFDLLAVPRTAFRHRSLLWQMTRRNIETRYRGSVQTLTTFILGMAWFILLFFGAWLILGGLSWTMLLLPVVLAPLIVFTLGVAYLVALLGVFIRDTSYVVGVILQILFFATPIFYPVSAVPERFRVWLEMNPLTVFIDQARRIFLYGRLPDWQFLGIAALVALAVLQFGFFFFTRTKRGFADVL